MNIFINITYQMNFNNHDQGLSVQKTLQRPVGRLSKTIKKMGNPFLDYIPDLLTLDSRNCVDELAVSVLHTLEEIGKKQYRTSSRKYFKNALIPSMTRSRILWPASRNLNSIQHEGDDA